MDLSMFIGYGSSVFMECGSHAAAAHAWLAQSISAPSAKGHQARL